MLSYSQRRFHCLLVLSMLLLAACSTSNTKLHAKQASLYFGAGTQSLMEKQYTEALKNLLEANKLDSNNPDILNNLGMAYYFKGEKELAIQHLKLSLKYNNENSDAYTNLASIYYRDGKVDEAEKLYKKVLKDLTYDKQARTFFNLGVIELQSRRNMVTAENYFKKSIKEDDNYCPSYHYLGLIQYNRRQFNSALRSFKDASMGSCYDSPAPHYYQALTMIELRRFDEARMKLDEIESRFKKSQYANKARYKVIELNEIVKTKSYESHASKRMLESSDF
jgi:type IV pilus assembly protein PilF